MKRAAHYTVRVADQICEQIVLGHGLEKALKKVGFLAPAYNTVLKWLEIYPDFNEKYERARRLQADILADRMLQLGEDVLNSPSTAAAHRVAVDILKWQAEVRNRSRYGAKSDDAGKGKALDPAKLRSEIKRLEAELGVAESKVTKLKAVGGTK